MQKGDGRLALELGALAVGDLAIVDADAHRRRVDAHLDPVAADLRAVVGHRGLAELHGVAEALAQRVVGEVREQLPQGAAEQFGQRSLEHAHGHAVGVCVAILPVQRHEGLVDLVEQGAGARLALLERGRRGRGVAPHAELAQAAVERGRHGTRRRFALHAHLEPAVDAQVERVHEGGDDEQPAAVVFARVGHALRPKARHVEAHTAVLDQRHQGAVVELEGDLDVGVDAAVADGVGGRLLDAQHEVVDQVALGAVLAQVVANALAGAPQVRRLGGNAKAQARRSRVGPYIAIRQLTPSTCVARWSVVHCKDSGRGRRRWRVGDAWGVGALRSTRRGSSCLRVPVKDDPSRKEGIHER